ncbi:hypothetical protein DY000_02014831 [Brassica cretica]|uniref:Uncharacterized protein n=1 Tax=Brassica cretica TaxID=69181 RepID=A0ABQ7CWE0_BRACR|nr:hypothetical protein DY000_02014831 [Brassica cretica]
MNKNLVENFLAFRNSQGRSRDAKDDQEDSPGDEVLGHRSRRERKDGETVETGGWGNFDSRISLHLFPYPRLFFYDRR